jgi:hypothetical protein
VFADRKEPASFPCGGFNYRREEKYKRRRKGRRKKKQRRGWGGGRGSLGCLPLLGKGRPRAARERNGADGEGAWSMEHGRWEGGCAMGCAHGCALSVVPPPPSLLFSFLFFLLFLFSFLKKSFLKSALRIFLLYRSPDIRPPLAARRSNLASKTLSPGLTCFCSAAAAALASSSGVPVAAPSHLSASPLCRCCCYLSHRCRCFPQQWH